MKAQLIDAPIVMDSDGIYTVWAVYDGVDRKQTVGMSCGKKKLLADRLRNACIAGKAIDMEAEVGTDCFGKTYAKGFFHVNGRKLNGDLRRLGF